MIRTRKELLAFLCEYETASTWLWMFPFAKLLGRYYAWKVKRKYANHLELFSEKVAPPAAKQSPQPACEADRSGSTHGYSEPPSSENDPSSTA